MKNRTMKAGTCIIIKNILAFAIMTLLIIAISFPCFVFALFMFSGLGMGPAIICAMFVTVGFNIINHFVNKEALISMYYGARVACHDWLVEHFEII